MVVKYESISARKLRLSMSDIESSSHKDSGDQSDIPLVHTRQGRRGSIPVKKKISLEARIKRLINNPFPALARRLKTGDGMATNAPIPLQTFSTVATEYVEKPYTSIIDGKYFNKAMSNYPGIAKAYSPVATPTPAVEITPSPTTKGSPTSGVEITPSPTTNGSPAVNFTPPPNFPQVHLPRSRRSSTVSHITSIEGAELIHSTAPGSTRSSTQGSISSAQSDLSEEDKNLKDLQRNIENMEQALLKKETIIDIDSEDDESRDQKLKNVGKRLLKSKPISSGKTVTIADGRRPKRSASARIKNFMRFGRGQSHLADAYDVEKGLIPVAGSSSDPRPPVIHVSIPSDEMLTDTSIIEDTSQLKRIRVTVDGTGPDVYKPAHFQVCVTVLEARHLVGVNNDPMVCVQIGDDRRYTRIKECTNCPYYNEYFVFDFNVPPIMLFDKIITLSVLHYRNFLHITKLLGSFKMDLATVWNQSDRLFYHKWALLTDPDDMTSGPKGYLKCDVSVNGKGDPVKIPPKMSAQDEDDIEANLLLPDGVPFERQRAKFIVKIHKADGLPKMGYTVFSGVRKAITGLNQDLVDPYVEVSFAGMTGHTSVKKNCNNPVWNEQITFTEMFPPLCQRIKIQLRDNAPGQSNVIGTHFIDLKTISHDGVKGFLPTFGPAYVHLYGSTREYSLLDQHSNLNVGMGEGVSYRGRVMISIQTEIMDGFDLPTANVQLAPALPINEASFEKHEQFFLFGTIFDANMIDEHLTDEPIKFELSIGNAGNSLDGPRKSVKRPTNIVVKDLNEVNADVGYWLSETPNMRAVTNAKKYYHITYDDIKPCMHIRSIWPDHRRRMFNSNMIAAIIDKFEEGLSNVQALIEKDNSLDIVINSLKATLEVVIACCAHYVERMTDATPFGNTTLDRDRQKMCIIEIEQLGDKIRVLKAIITKNSAKERLRTAYIYLNKLKQMCEDPQHTMPDVFIWMISNNKRLAYYRIAARDIIFSESPDETGKFCAKMQTVFLKWPGEKAATSSGWSIPAKLNLYLWLGAIQHKKHYFSGLPPGYDVEPEIIGAGDVRMSGPSTILYREKHRFQLRAYIYQARSLIGSDSSGLSDPFANVIIGENVATTQVIDETLSPTWDQLLVFNEVLLFSTMEQIKQYPPSIAVEVFDEDKLGKPEFIGRALARPIVKNIEEVCDPHKRPIALEWHDIFRGTDNAGELLAAFELLEVPPDKDASNLPPLPPPKEISAKIAANFRRSLILPIPSDIRPTLSKYRIEILFWGLRNLKRIHFTSVDKPRVDIECAGTIIYSAVIQSVKDNPNFSNSVKFIDVELPDQDLYRPPLTIRAVDCRSFGRNTLVGTHTINSINKYVFTPMTRKERAIEERKRTLIQLQNIDLKNNCIYQEQIYTVKQEKENIPLLPRDIRPTTPCELGVITKQPRRSLFKSATRARPMRHEKPGRRMRSTDSVYDDDDVIRDWWTKYFSSAEFMLKKEREAQEEKLGPSQSSHPVSSDEARSPVEPPRPERFWRRRPAPDSSRMKICSTPVPKKKEIPKSAMVKIYPHELEAAAEYDEFKDWLHTFELYRGKKTADEVDDENRIVGTFKGAVKVYKWPLPKDADDFTVMGLDPNFGFFQGLPNNEPIRVLVRVYIVQATDLHPMDPNGKADPYLVLQLGSKKICDKDNYVSKQLNPVFGKCFEIEATFPQDSMLSIQVLDWDLVGSDDLIGETKIDLENRFYSRHRATCGLPLRYEEQGYNRWRDSMKPTQILAKLCKEGRLEPPVYDQTRVQVGRTIFNIPIHDPELFCFGDTIKEQMALHVLHRWQEVPRIGTRLVTEHVETRPLFQPNKPGMEKGRLVMWVDMFPMDMPLPGPPVDISPRKPKPYELRVIIWNTDDVVLEDDTFFSGEKMSDIYVKGSLKGSEDSQSTDVHYRSLTGEGNFNWRFVFPFDYLEAEELIVIIRKETMFSWDESESKVPARLTLEVWDADHFSSDDFLGALTLDLNRFPRGAKTSKLCTLKMLRNDGTVPMVNLFKQKRVKGWWPLYVKHNNYEMELSGKVEAEILLLTREEADMMPAGLGRSEPDALDKPNRPDAAILWFLHPLKSLRYVLWRNYKWPIFKTITITFVTIFCFAFVYSVPVYTAKLLLGA